MKKTISKSDFVPKTTDDIAQLQKHLGLFGYLNAEDCAHASDELPPEPDDEESTLEPNVIEEGKLDKPTIEALKKYQHFHCLECSGKLDEGTINSMGKKRCAMPDSIVAEFSAQGNKWNKTEITYGFQNYTADNGLTPAKIHQAIAQAFSLWAAETPLSFRLVNFSANPDIRIRFASGNHGDGASFDGRSGVLAHAFYPPPNGGALAGDAHFDEAESWTINIPTGSGKIDLVTVAAHEFGHSLGLRHSNVNGSMMFPSYSGPKRALHRDDKAGIRRIYGGYNIAHASWIHGTSVQIEYPERLQRIKRAGFYTYLYGKANTTNWFHFAIPTPVIVDKKRLKILCAILRFRTFSDNAIVKHVQIYDGYSKIASHNNINLSGNQWFTKFGVAHKPYVRWGLGISLGVEFKGGTVGSRRMDFVAAGCDLIK